MSWPKPTLTKVALGVAASGVVTTVGVYAIRTYARTALSWVLSYTAVNEEYREVFRTLVDPQVTPAREHSHPVAASTRRKGEILMESFSAMTKLTDFHVQYAHRNQKAGQQGSLEWYWAKDVSATPSLYDPAPDSVICITDVDYYIDMPKFLVGKCGYRPVLISTVVPDSASKATPEHTYWFNEDQSLSYFVHGGADYRGMIWDYNTDSLLVTQWWPTWECWLPTTIVYLVERRQLDPDHQLILLAPKLRARGVFAWLAAVLLEGTPLKHLRPVKSGWTRLRVMDGRGNYISTARAGCDLACNVESTTDAAIATLARTIKGRLDLGQVLSYMGDRISPDRSQEEKRKALVLCDYYLENHTQCEPIIHKMEESTRRYQVLQRRPDDSAKPGMIPIASPLIHEGWAPDICLENEESAIEGRIIETRNDCKPPDRFYRYAREFVNFVLGEEAGTLVPVSEDYVRDAQNRPSQRAILDRAGWTANPIHIVKSFLKREAYAGPKDPRVITTYDSVIKDEYSKFVYPLSDLIAKQPWYAFGKTPHDLALRVVEILQQSSSVCETDFGRFDGTISEFLRYCEALLILAAFAPGYAHEAKRLHDRQYNVHGITTHGVWYYLLYGRGSGSPETSTLNSFDNALVDYFTNRESNHAPAEAYALVCRLGLFGGDDGIAGDVDSKVYVKTASTLGLRLDCVVRKRGTSGVSFLARIFGPGAWCGDTNSMCDVKRTLSKIHLTTSLPSNTESARLVRWQEKMTSLALTDRHTPIVSVLVSTTSSSVGLLAQSDLSPSFRLENWWSKFDLDVQWPNRPAAWMQTYTDSVLPTFNIQAFRLWSRSVRRGKRDLLALPLCVEPTQLPDGGNIYEVGSMSHFVEIPEKDSDTKRPTGYPVKEWRCLVPEQRQIIVDLAAKCPDLDWDWLGPKGRARIFEADMFPAC